MTQTSQEFWRQKFAEQEAKYHALVAEDSVRSKVAVALTAYSNTTKHDDDCIGFSEGQSCCIDFYHENFYTLLDVIAGALDK